MTTPQGMLAPCPFCGSSPQQDHPDQPHGGMIQCQSCGAQAFGFDKWNARLSAAPQGREALEEALRGLQYIAPSIPVLRTMFMTADLKLGAAKAEEMDASNKEAIEKLKAVLAALTPVVAPDAGAGEALKSVENEIARKIDQLDEYIVQHCQGDAPEKVHARTIAEGRKLQANMDLILVARAALARNRGRTSDEILV